MLLTFPSWQPSQQCSVFMFLVYSQLLLAANTEPLIVLGFIPMILITLQGHESSSSYQAEIVPFLTEHFKASLFEIQKGVTSFGHINIGEKMMEFKTNLIDMWFR